MAVRGEELNTRITATDDASAVVDKVADKVGELEDQPHDVKLGADTDQAEADIRNLDKRLDGLTDDQKQVVLQVMARDAQRDLDRFNRELARAEKFSDQEIQLRLEARGNAEQKLDRIQSELREIDGATPKVEVQVEAKGLDEVTQQLANMPGIAGSAGAGLSRALTTPGLAAAGLLGTLIAVGNAQANNALLAAEVARQTGASIEEASQLVGVWTRSGAEVKDLQDILNQMNGVLSTSPEIAERLGVSLDDGRNGVDRFTTAVDNLNNRISDVGERGVLAAQLFGEEGVRQVTTLQNLIDGPLTQAVDNFAGKLFSDADVERARELKRDAADLRSEGEKFAASLGSTMVPVLDGILKGGNALFDGAREWGETTRAIFTEFSLETGSQKLVSEFEASIAAAQGFDAALLEGLTTFEQVHAAVLAHTGDLTAANVVGIQWKETVGAQIDAEREHVAMLQDVRLQTDGLRASTAELDAATRAEEQAQRDHVAALQETRLQTDGLRTSTSDAALAMAALEANTRLVGSALSEANAQISAERALLDLEDQLVRVAEAEARIGEAAKESDAKGAEAKRNHRREVLRLQEMVLNLLATYDDIPAEKVTEIITKIQSGDLATIAEALDELTKDRFVRIGVVMPDIKKAFDSIDISFGFGGGGPTPVYNGANAAPSQSTTNVYNQTFLVPPPTPTTSAVDRRVYDERNGVRGPY